MECTLAKALKIKNRLAQRLQEVQTEIRSFNASIKEQSGKVDVRALNTTRQSIEDALVAVKTAIAKANAAGSSEAIFRMSELKSTIQFWRCVPTTDGVVKHHTQNTDIYWVAEFKKDEVDNEVLSLQRKLDDLQDVLDEYNNKTMVTVPDNSLEL